MPNQTTASNILVEIAAQLKRARRVLVMTHIAPDGDAIGSLLGLGWILRDMGREPALLEVDPIPEELHDLPGFDAILAEPPPGPWDAVVSLDASDVQRLGREYRPADYNGAPVIVIDHHITNTRFGTFNCVDPTAAATAQIIVQLAEALDVSLSVPAARCLLTGLVTDTLAFRTSNVTPEVMATAMRLMECGANLAQITEQALNRRPLGMIRLWGPALQGLQVRDHVIWTKITHAMRTDAGAPENSVGGLVSFLLSAMEARVAAVFAERHDGRVEISFRSRPGYDVAQVAFSLGGGGHPQASGCTVDGPLASAEARVLPLLERAAE